jgi:hypothetical protein
MRTNLPPCHFAPGRGNGSHVSNVQKPVCRKAGALVVFVTKPHETCPSERLNEPKAHGLGKAQRYQVSSPYKVCGFVISSGQTNLLACSPNRTAGQEFATSDRDFVKQSAATPNPTVAWTYAGARAKQLSDVRGQARSSLRPSVSRQRPAAEGTCRWGSCIPHPQPSDLASGEFQFQTSKDHGSSSLRHSLPAAPGF